MADRVRFELTVHCCTAVFKTAALNRSATHPVFSTIQRKTGLGLPLVDDPWNSFDDRGSKKDAVTLLYCVPLLLWRTSMDRSPYTIDSTATRLGSGADTGAQRVLRNTYLLLSSSLLLSMRSVPVWGFATAGTCGGRRSGPPCASSLVSPL